MIRVSAIRCVLLLGLPGMLFGPVVRAADSQPQVFSGVPDRAGFRGGLIVHLGCGDGRSTGQLAASGNRLVHGLDTDVAEVQAARTHLHQSGLYGRGPWDPQPIHRNFVIQDDGPELSDTTGLLVNHINACWGGGGEGEGPAALQGRA